ncbi:hypothetical protein FA95DRAFT_1607162 [Auriscalpium vulgare]|uniref:Uncharacterized protein n=1 Tax=Auriscalpium vulgare TaxID=40419 RepID=A0ACB8RQ70_9AGAM|nr:hypothetical protein FA95DRAFT_1607162 [Auriscalpium vulgare]
MSALTSLASDQGLARPRMPCRPLICERAARAEVIQHDINMTPTASLLTARIAGRPPARHAS